MNFFLQRASLYFFPSYFGLFAVLELAWYHGSGAVLVYRGCPFSCSCARYFLIVGTSAPDDQCKFLKLHSTIPVD